MATNSEPVNQIPTSNVKTEQKQTEANQEQLKPTTEQKKQSLEEPDREKPQQKDPLTILYRIVETYKNQPNQDDYTLLMHQQKLIYFALDCFQKGVSQHPAVFDFTQEFQQFQMQMNVRSMQFFRERKDDDTIFNIIKAVDMLLHKSIHKFVNPIQKLGECQVLTFNNLACIYQSRRQYGHALKAVTFALEMEEKLVMDDWADSQKSIISTLLNQGAILSALQQHEQALDCLQKAQDNLQSYEGKFAQKKFEQQEEKNVQLKLIQGLKLVAFYNSGVEFEHLLHKQRAQHFYQEALQVAEELGEQDMKARLKKAIQGKQ